MDKTFYSDYCTEEGTRGGYAAYRERDVELSAEDEQDDEDSAVDDDGVVDGFRFHE